MKLLLSSLALVVLLLTGCQQQHPQYQVIQDPNGQQLVNVDYYDQNGNYQNIFMEYALFTSLMRQGGYNSVYNYYRSNPNYYRNTAQYRTYQPVGPQQYNYNGEPGARSYSPPVQNKVERSYSPPVQSEDIHPSGQQTPRSYSPPAQRVEPTRSYSPPTQRVEPTRSYTPPTQSTPRSYSPPSQSTRSYSPPTRVSSPPHQ